MVQALRTKITIQPGGVVTFTSPELPPGATAEVIVLVNNDYDLDSPPVANELYMASESSLAKDWLLPEEDEAWKDL